MATYHGEPYPGFFKNTKDTNSNISSEIKSWEVDWFAHAQPAYYDVTTDAVNIHNGDVWLKDKASEWLMAPKDDDVNKYALISTAETSNNCISFANSGWTHSITILGAENSMLVSIASDGTVTLGNGVKDIEDAVSRSYWQLLETYGHQRAIRSLNEHAGMALEELRIILGVPDGESITEYAKMLMKELADRLVIEADPIQIKEDPTVAYARAMKVVE